MVARPLEQAQPRPAGVARGEAGEVEGVPAEAEGLAEAEENSWLVVLLSGCMKLCAYIAGNVLQCRCLPKCMRLLCTLCKTLMCATESSQQKMLWSEVDAA